MATDSSVTELVRRTEDIALAKQQQLEFASIEDAIDDLQLGRVIVVTDDEDRENEGDLIMAADMISRRPSASWPLMEEAWSASP